MECRVERGAEGAGGGAGPVGGEESGGEVGVAKGDAAPGVDHENAGSDGVEGSWGGEDCFAKRLAVTVV